MEQSFASSPAVPSLSDGRGLPRDLQRFLLVTAALTFTCLAIEWFCRIILHYKYPYTWPLMPRQDPYRDLYLYKERYAFFHSSQFFSFDGEAYLYPAPVAIFYRIFYSFSASTQVFLAALSSAFSIAAILFGRAIRRAGISLPSVLLFIMVICACAYPFFFEFEQANLEFVLWLLIAGGIWLFLRGHGYSAAVLFGIAISAKIFPLVFLGLFLSRKQYRQILVALFSAGMSTLVSLWMVCPNLAASWRGVQDGIATFRRIYMLGYVAVGFDHSLFAIPKAIMGSLKPITHSPLPPGPQVVALILAVYLPTVAILGILLYWFKIRHLPTINQIICLTTASILLPPTSYDYTLIHLYAPFALLVIFCIGNRDASKQGVWGALLCFAILLAPETEFILWHHTISGQIKSLTLVALMVIALRNPFKSEYDHQRLPAEVL